MRDKLRYLCGLDDAYALTTLLFVNDLVPSVLTVTADLVECGLPLYARVNLDAAGWTVSVAGGLATATRAVITFTFGPNSGGSSIYGYSALNTVSGRTAFAERFPSPYVVPAAGGTLTLAVTWYDQGLS